MCAKQRRGWLERRSGKRAVRTNSLVKMADLILVLSDGKIVERGTHEELINLKGIYQQMFRSQASWYNRAN